MFIGSTNISNSIVENEEFWLLVKVLDSRYPMPGRTLIGKELDKVLATLKHNMEGFLSEARRVSLCGDIWSELSWSNSSLFFKKRL